MTFSDAGTPDVENLYARIGDSAPHLMFAGHTDVVPAGDEASWTHPPFAARNRRRQALRARRGRHEGRHRLLHRRRARHLAANGGKPKGSISFLITGDEEGVADQRHHQAARHGRPSTARTWITAFVGEPTNPDALGDTIKIGRRGSLSARSSSRASRAMSPIRISPTIRCAGSWR